MSQEICPDNTPCDKHFNAEGRMICHHGLCEMYWQDSNYGTALTIVCPLELQRLNQKSQWDCFFKMLPETRKKILQSFREKLIEKEEKQA